MKHVLSNKQTQLVLQPSTIFAFGHYQLISWLVGKAFGQGLWNAHHEFPD